MIDSALDNPVWHSLAAAHRAFAQSSGDTCWYPAGIAPFIAVQHATAVPDLDAAARQAFRAPAYFIGVVPASLPAGWRVAELSSIVQLLPGGVLPTTTEYPVRLLGAADRPGMLDLARRAFPDFFRERTAELGDYFGIFSDEVLVAMAGERLTVDGMKEISGVCTHPEFMGRGHARRLTRALLERHRMAGVGSFLHVSAANSVARRLYQSMGFVERASLPLAKIDSAAPR